MTHKTCIIGNRTLDNSLVYRCEQCQKTGLGLLGPCAPPSGRSGRRKRVAQQEREAEKIRGKD